MELDKDGFVFIDGMDRVYKCCVLENKSWLLKWNNNNKCWTTLHEINSQDVNEYYELLNKNASQALINILSHKGIIK